MNRVHILLLCSFYGSFLQGAFSRIIPIDSIDEAAPLIKTHVSMSLVLIDVDDTLMIAKDKVMRNANIRFHHQFMSYVHAQPDDAALTRTIFQHAEYMLVDPQIVMFIEEWKKHAVGVYGFTARSVGSFAGGLNAEKWVSKKLEDLGVTFRTLNIDLPNFRNGFIFCHPDSKGDVLTKFLLAANLKNLDTIIMIDDRLDIIENVASAVAAWNANSDMQLNFLGFHYKAVNYLEHTIDLELVKKQLDYLILYKIYLSEEEARACAYVPAGAYQFGR